MVDVTCEIDQAAVARLDGLLTRVQQETPGRLAAQTRRAAIYICTSLRARTKKAKKSIKSYPSEWSASVSPNPPRYVHSNSAGHALLRRWSLTRKKGTPAQYTMDHYVYTKAHRAKNGKMVGKSPSAELRELLKNHGGISRAGLAKKSWGWAMKQIYNGASAGDIAWRSTRGERRDPRQYVKGLFQRTATGAGVSIDNNLDYILDALQPGALAEAMDAATKRLEYNLAADLLRAENAPAAVHRSAYQNWIAHTKGWW